MAEWEGFGNERRVVQLHVLTPVDLAVSKISRFPQQDRLDIQALAAAGLVTDAALRERAREAMDYYVGNKAPVLTNLDQIARDIQALGSVPTVATKRSAPRNGPRIGP